MKMKGKSPMMKALVGNQKNLNEGLKAAIKAAPGKMMAKTPSVMERMKTAMKVRGMGEDAVGKVRGMGEKSPNKIMKEKAVAKVAKPDFPDIDGDGDRKESISKAAADKKTKSPAKAFVIVAEGKNKRQDKRFFKQAGRDAELKEKNPKKAVKRGERLSKKADKQEARKAKGKKIDEGKLLQRKLRSSELKSAAK